MLGRASATTRRHPFGAALREIPPASSRYTTLKPGDIERILAGEQLNEPSLPVASGADPEFLAEMAALDPAAVEKVRAYVRGLKDGRG